MKGRDLGRSVCHSDSLGESKKEFASFEWQGGYAAFSVSQSNLIPVRDYIAGQEEHHRKADFKTELMAMLRRHGLEWDERHVWD